jgi:hypothetical protein
MSDTNPRDDYYDLRRDLANLRRELLTLSETLSATTIMATAAGAGRGGMNFDTQAKGFIESLQGLAEQAKANPYYPDPHVFTHQSHGGALICHLLEDEVFSVWARDDKADPAVVSIETLRAFHRYLSALVLPKVERSEESFGVVLEAEDASVCLRDGNVRVLGKVYPGRRCRALAACLLAAADEAEGVAP